MPRRPLGNFSSTGGVSRFYDFKRPVTFYDKVRFVGATSSVEINGGVLTGDFDVTGDLSGNWDGASPASLTTVDGAATTGYYFDSSLGAAQLMGSLWLGGDITLTGSGAFHSAPDGNHRVELQQTRLAFYDDADSLKGTIKVDATSDDFEIRSQVYPSPGIVMSDVITINDPYIPVSDVIQFEADTAETVSNESWMGSYYSGATGNIFQIAGPQTTSTNPMSIRFEGSQISFTNSNAVAGGSIMAALTRGGFFRASNGSASTPGFSFMNDTDTGMFLSATSTLELATAGTTRIDINTTYTEFRNTSGTTRYWLASNDHYFNANNIYFRSTGSVNKFRLTNTQFISFVNGDGTTPAFSFDNDGFYDSGFYFSDSLNRIYVTVGANSSAFFNGNGIYAAQNNVEQLGNDTVEWKDVWATDTTINSSDPRKKKDIIPLSASVDAGALVRAVTPIQFKWKEGTRDHWGWNIEQVAESIRDQGLDPGDYGVYIDPVLSHDDEYLQQFPEAKDQPAYKHMRQAELLPILWEEVKRLQIEVDRLTSMCYNDQDTGGANTHVQ